MTLTEATESVLTTSAAPSSYSDPTYNVLRLVEAEARRLGDIITSEVKGLHALHVQDAENLRQRFVSADAHLRELINVRADGNQRLIEAGERLTDVRAKYDELLRIAAEKQAEALATQLASVAADSRTIMDTRFALVDTRLGELQVQLSSLVSSLAASQAQKVETRADTSETRLNWGGVVGGLALVVAVILLVVTLTA